MDVWAEKYFGRATFICISCEGPQLATAFGKRLQLSKCLLTYLDDANGPSWGQLGCEGFIVLNGQGEVASRATPAYLQVKERAFTHVEALLDSLLAKAPLPLLTPCEGEGEAEDKPFDGTTACRRVTTDGDGEADGEPMPKRMQRANENAIPTTSVAPLADIISVHIEELDAEHAKCAAALAELRESPTREVILRVVEAYTAHFQHEEMLLDQHLYTPAATAADSSGGFNAAASARRSHYVDHERMLGDLRARAKELPAGGPPSGPKAWIYAASEAPAAFVDRVLRSFEQHANSYDAAYAEELVARLHEAEAVPVQ